MITNLKNKKVFISGSSKGIGLSIAQQFINEDAVVCINSRYKKNLLNISEKIQNNNLKFVVGDLTKESKIKEAVDKAAKEMKGIDILICNLGDGRKVKPSGDENFIDWEKSLKINLLSCTNLVYHSLKYLKRSTNASIVCISSTCGIVTSQAPLDYSAFKSAMISYVRNQSINLSKFGIRINCVTPGNIFSLDGRWPEKFKKNSKLKNEIINQIPLGRFGDVEEISNAVIFLSSNLSSYTTGANLVIDGGFSL